MNAPTAPFAGRPAARLSLLMLDRGRDLGCEHRPGVPAPLTVSELARLVWPEEHARKRHLLLGWLDGRQTRTQTVLDVAAYFDVDPGVFTEKPADDTGATLIAAERSRQLSEWPASHDAEHTDGRLSVAAAQLAVCGTDETVTNYAHEPDCWGLVRKHGHDRVRSLTIAGALIAAEIDRELSSGAADS